MSVLFEVSHQCCDAGSYMQFGAECAADIKQCYGDLRPVGDYLWFSLPERLGLPPESIVAIHFLIALASVFFCTWVLRVFLEAHSRVQVTKTLSFFLFLVCLGVHVIFLRPTIFNTLSDPPSVVALLLGIGCLVLSSCYAGFSVKKAFLIALAGVFLGVAAWLRAFYLYPVLACVGVYCFLWLFQRKKEWKELLLLIAIIPIATQFFVMYRAYGTIGYLQQDIQSDWTQVHLNAPYIGFDTIMPRNGYFWEPQHCESQVGIVNGLKLKDYKGVACIISERLRFYFGTYERETYIYTDAKSYLVRQYSEDVGSLEADWFPQNLTYEENVEIAPSGQKTADKLTVVSPAVSGIGDVVQWIELPANTPFTFSVWLWSPKLKTIKLAIKYHADDKPVAKRQFTLTPEPTRFWVTGTTARRGLYDVDIGRTPYAEDAITFGTETGDFFYAWGAQLEKGNEATAYDASGKISPSSVRNWKPWLLGLNIAAFFLVAGMIVRLRVFWLQTKPGIAVLSFFTVVLAECVAIIPEQRFVIGLMIVLWGSALTTLLALLKILLKKSCTRN